MNISNYFSQPHCVAQKQYEALRMYYFDNKKAASADIKIEDKEIIVKLKKKRNFK